MKKGILLMVPFILLAFTGCGRRNNTDVPTTTKTTKTTTTKEPTTSKEDPIPQSNKDIYVSSTGKASNDGSDEANPTTLEHALKLVYTGDTIYLAKGTYTFDNTISINPDEHKNGSEVKRNRIIAKEGAVFDFDSTIGDSTSNNGGIIIKCSYWELENITVKNSDNYGFDVTGKGNRFINCTADNNSNGGFNINNANLTSLSNCVSNNNHLVGYYAHGFKISGSGENNIFDSCVATNNQDSGFYVDNTKKITFNKCLASSNGLEYNTGSINRSGFVFNDKGHTFTDCISYNNAFYGFFVPTSPSDKSDYKLTDCSAINNHEKNYNLVTSRNTAVTITNALSYNDDTHASNDFLVGKVVNSFIYYSKKYFYVKSEDDFKNDTSRKPLDLSGYTNKYVINTTIPNEMKKDGKIVYFDDENNINIYGYLDRSEKFQIEFFGKQTNYKLFGASFSE